MRMVFCCDLKRRSIIIGENESIWCELQMGNLFLLIMSVKTLDAGL
ncbi:hypothetical protein [Bacillus sp. Bos-x628]